MPETETIVLSKGDDENGYRCVCTPGGRVQETTWYDQGMGVKSSYTSSYTVHQEDLATARMFDNPSSGFHKTRAVMRVHQYYHAGDNGPGSGVSERKSAVVEEDVPLQALVHHFGELPPHLQ